MGAAPAEPSASDAMTAMRSAPPRARARTGRLLCWLLLTLLLTATGWAMQYSARGVEQRREYVFQAEAAMLKLRLEEQLQPYRSLSRILVGFFLASQTVEPAEWQVFLRAQQLERTLPHFERAWFAFETGDPLAPHYLAQRDDPSQPLPVWRRDRADATHGPAPRSLPLLYLEPSLAGAAGADLYAANAEAIERAYGLRETVLEPRFELLPGAPAGFAFVSPFFRPDELAESSRPALEGLLGVSLDFDGLLRRLLADAPTGLGIEVHRGDAVGADSLLLASGPLANGAAGALRVVEQVEYAAQPLTLVFHAPPGWQAAEFEHRGPLYVGLAGLVISLLGFAIAWSLEGTRDRAIAMAERMTIELREINRVLAEMATTDSLTGLRNRRAFFDHLSAELRRVRRYRQPCSLVLFDIDHFKQINDTHGHPAGDAVLRAVGALLRDQLREADTAGRIGGEEFAVLLPHTGIEQARQVAEQLRAALRALAHREGEVVFHSTASFGVTASDTGSETPERLMRRVDQALYRAKAGGRDRVEWQRDDPNRMAGNEVGPD